MNFLRQRRCRPEILDQPDLSVDRRNKALHGLARINFWSQSAGILWPDLAELVRTMTPRVPRVLDVATGAGDVLIRLGRRARRAGVELHLEGCDISPAHLEHARGRAVAAGVPIRLFEYDARTGAALTGYDAIMCSLFLHHLEDSQAVALLRRMSEMAGRLILVNDLERGWTGWLAAHVATRLLTTSTVVHYDGPCSVEAAFTRTEARSLAEAAGLRDARVVRRWPFRWLLTWRRP